MVIAAIAVIAVFAVILMGAEYLRRESASLQQTCSSRSLPESWQRSGIIGVRTLQSLHESPLALLLADGSAWSDPTWNSADRLGSFVFDRHESMWIASSPALGYLQPALRIWKLDGVTFRLTPIVTLTLSTPPRHLFGVIDLAYDCMHDVLYATDVTQTGMPLTGQGRIIEIDARDPRQPPRIRSVVDGIDGLGIGAALLNGEPVVLVGNADSPSLTMVHLARGKRWVIPVPTERSDQRVTRIKIDPLPDTSTALITLTAQRFTFQLLPDPEPTTLRGVVRADGDSWVWEPVR